MVSKGEFALYAWERAHNVLKKRKQKRKKVQIIEYDSNFIVFNYK